MLNENEVMETTNTLWKHRFTAKKAAFVKGFGMMMESRDVRKVVGDAYC